MKLVNAESRQLEDISNPEQAFLEGTHGFLQGSKVPFVNPSDGSIYLVDSSNAEEAIKVGARFATDEELRNRQLEKQYGEGIGSGAKALGEGIARGLTFGLSDSLLKGLGIDEQGLRERKERNRGLAITGEIAGTILPILASGGTGAFAKVAGKAPSSIITRIGTRTEKEIAKRLIKNAVTKEGIKQATLGPSGKILSKLGASAVEGAFYGVQGLNSEAALGNAEYNAENLMAHAGLGAITSGALTGTLGIGKEIAQKTVVPLASKAIKSITDRIGKDVLEETSYKLASKSLSPTLSFKRMAREFPHGYEGVGEDILKSKAFQMGRNPEEMLDDFISLTEEHGAKIGNIVSKLDDDIAATGGQVKNTSWANIYKSIKNEVVDDLKKSDVPELRNIGSKVEEQFSILNQEFPPGQSIPFTRLHNFRKRLDNLIYTGAKPKEDTFKFHLQEARRVLEKKIEGKIDETYKALGVPNAYKTDKRLYQSYRWARDVIKDRIDRNDVNRHFSLTDYGVGSAGAITTAMLTGGLNLKVLAVGLLAGSINKFARTRGNTYLAEAFNRASKLGGIWKATDNIEKRLSNKVSSFLKITKPLERPVAPISSGILNNLSFLDKKPSEAKNKLEAFNKVRDELHALTTDPNLIQEKIANSIKDISLDAPNVSQMLIMKQAEALQYLYNTLPKRNMPQGILAKDDKFQPSDADLAKWERVVSAVNDPLSVLDDLDNGMATKEGIDAIQAIYPRIYSRIVEEMIEKINDPNAKISYGNALQLRTLFGIPIDYMTSPVFIAQMQQNYMGPVGIEQQVPQQRAKVGKKPDISSQAKTDVSRALENIGGF